MRVKLALGQVGLSQVSSGQVDLVRSRPGPILSLVGMCLIKMRVYSTKFGGRMSDSKKHNFMLCLFHFLYCTRGTLYQLMSVDIECP